MPGPRPSSAPPRALVIERWLASRLGSGDLRELEGILVDLRALAGWRFACRTELCAPGRRRRGVVSCCADLDVPLTQAEWRAVKAHEPFLRRVLAGRDPRWEPGRRPPSLRARDRVSLSRPGGRCVLAFPAAGGLRCALHLAAEEAGLTVAELKPLNCRLFPLALLEHGGRSILTAAVGEVATFLGGPPEGCLACLAPDGRQGSRATPLLFRSCRDSLVELFGARFHRRLAAVIGRRGARTRG